MLKSSHFNPFRYVQSEVDILKLITNLISNTTPKGSSTNDPFWEKAEGMLLQALFFYVWLEGVPENVYECKTQEGQDDIEEILEKIDNPKVSKLHNVRAVMELLKYAEFKEDPATGAKMDSVLDKIMENLERKNTNHKAVLNYNKVMLGAADTVRSIIISANARLAPIQSEAILQILDDDEIDISTLGTQKTVVYCVIPDNDKTYNFLVGMLYSIMFQQLYYEADFVHGGRLPVHVTFLLDEFANVALPDDYLSLLSTMRSREISSIIIIQDLSQIKTLFKDGQHEAIIANCDTMVYLGGNGPSTQKELSELMGKATIDKRTAGETLGTHGSSSRNYDVLGRELMFPDELRKMEGKKCILFIRGFDPILDDKIHSTEHPLWNQMCEAGKKESFDARLERSRKKGRKKERKETKELLFQSEEFVDFAEYQHLKLMDQKEQRYYEREKAVAEETGEICPQKSKPHVVDLSYEEIRLIQEKMEKVTKEPVVLNEELIKEARKAALHLAEKQEEESRSEEERKICVTDFNTPEEAILYAKLIKAKYQNEQIKQIMRLVKEKVNLQPKEIIEKFDTSMDVQLITFMVETMVKQVS